MDRVTYRKNYPNLSEVTVVINGAKISVTVTARASVVKKWLQKTQYYFRRYVYLNRLVVGLGVQWTTGGRYLSTDTLQLCVGSRCLIFQLAHANSVPRKLERFLLNPCHTFVGFWNHSDLKKLTRSVHKLAMAKHPLDLRLYAKPDNVDLTQASVEEIVEKCLGFEVQQRREIGTSVWYNKDLSNEQVTYATVDAYCAYLIGVRIGAWQYNG